MGFALIGGIVVAILIMLAAERAARKAQDQAKMKSLATKIAGLTVALFVLIVVLGSFYIVTLVTKIVDGVFGL